MRVVPRRTVVGDIDRRFDNLSGSHHQSHVCSFSNTGATLDTDIASSPGALMVETDCVNTTTSVPRCSSWCL